jgi:putative N6-adenine-specific DNA methylase
VTAPHRYDVPCTLGLETVLAGELKALGANEVKVRRGGVTCEGDRALGYKACLWLRSAVRVQELLATFEVRSEQDLYDHVHELPWERWLSADDTLAVDATVRDSIMTHSGYVAIRTKDAIVDRFRDREGRRPSVDRERPSLPLRLRLTKGRASLARDLAGSSLHKRGYRPVQVKSPLNEATAAGLLLLAGYDGTGAFIDPLCGSGTFLVEAAWIAMDRAPGLDRRFAFTNWPDFDRQLWREIVSEAFDRVRSDVPAHFIGLDNHAGAVSIAQQSLASAEVGHLVDIVHGDAARWRAPEPPEWVFTNPPWGERLTESVEESWDALASFLRASPGSRVHVLSGSPELTRRLRMKADRKWAVRSGPIDCRLLRYDVHERKAAGRG